jgi:hypothetical protein
MKVKLQRVILMATLDNLPSQITDIVNEYSDNIKKSLEAKLDETAKSIIAYIKSNAPRSGKSGALADSFVTSETGVGVNKVITIYSKTKGRIIHLVEFGYVHRSGKYVAPRPFFRVAYDALTPKMLEDIKNIIKNGGFL